MEAISGLRTVGLQLPLLLRQQLGDPLSQLAVALPVSCQESPVG